MLARTAIVFVVACVHLILAACDLAPNASDTPNVSQLPLRSSCIVGYRLLWGDDEPYAPEVINGMSVDLPSELHSIRPNGIAMPDKRTKLYMIFGSNCERRQAMSDRLVAYWKRTIPNYPQTEFIEGLITPSVDTIDVKGMNWSD